MRLIDADKLINEIVYKCGLKHRDAILEIDNAPTIDPVKHGHWISKYWDGGSEHHCSECGAIYKDLYDLYSYCPNCGAKMEVKE